MTLDDLERMDRRALAACFASGTEVLHDDLAGRSLRGVCVGNPAWFERLTWKRFRKVFAADGRSGHNEAVRRDGSFEPASIRGNTVRYGRFTVRVEDGSALIDYGGAVDPLRRVGPGLLLGVTELRVGGRRLRTPTWFALLER